MIRAIKTDQDFYPEWSPFGSHVVLDIRYMTNESNFRCYVSVLGVLYPSLWFSIIGILTMIRAGHN